jgi:hypothetical protein
MKDKVIFEEQDNWINFSYSENRILDSLAAIFHVQSPCTAVAIYDSTLHISYNTHITKSDKITSALNSLLLEKLLDRNCEMLFSLHLLTNRDFSDFINLQKNMN